MQMTALHLKPREADAAELRAINTPLHERVFNRFLNELTKLVRRGLRFDYQQIEAASRFVRGQLNRGRQSRQSPDLAAWFYIRHELDTPNRIENRLLKTALGYVLKITGDADNWRLVNELAHQLRDLEPYTQRFTDLPRWQTGRLMHSYIAIKRWCVLILEKLNPNFQKGSNQEVALLFRMEVLPLVSGVCRLLFEQLADQQHTQEAGKHRVFSVSQASGGLP